MSKFVTDIVNILADRENPISTSDSITPLPQTRHEEVVYADIADEDEEFHDANEMVV